MTRIPNNDELDNRYSYHAPLRDQPERYRLVREGCLELAKLIRDEAPASRDRDLAFDALDEVMFRTNAAIARTEG